MRLFGEAAMGVMAVGLKADLPIYHASSPTLVGEYIGFVRVSAREFSKTGLRFGSLGEKQIEISIYDLMLKDVDLTLELGPKSVMANGGKGGDYVLWLLSDRKIGRVVTYVDFGGMNVKPKKTKLRQTSALADAIDEGIRGAM